MLRMVYGRIRVTVPFSKVANSGLRPITKNAGICRILTYLAAGHCHSSSDWKVRFKVNSEKMFSGNLLQVAEVLKSLLELQKDRPLSFREQKMFDRSRHMLGTELSIARGIDDAEPTALFQKYF